MKYPFLFLVVAILLATFVIVMLGVAAFAEVKELITGNGHAEELTE